jgi:protoporphyrinogen oxidase
VHVSSGAPAVILGGGPSGLACAWELARRGHPAIVLERETRSGGLCATIEKDGYRFDLGGHRFVSKNAELSSLVSRLLGPDLLEQERRSVVLHGGRSFRYPLEPLDLVRALGVRENVRAFGGYGWERCRQRFSPSPDRTFEDWVVARFGRPLYERFFGPYTEKLWGIPAAEISADWAAQRIGLMNLGDATLRLMGLRTKPIRTYARRYLYPRLGMGQLFARLADEIERLGARVVLGAEVVGFETAGGTVTAVKARVGAEIASFPCSHVYATIPLTSLVGKLDPAPPPEVDRAAEALRFRAIRFVNVLLAREVVSPNTWMYVADVRYRIARIQEPKHRSPFMAPAGCTSLMLELPCNVGDNIWNADDNEILELGLGELEELGVRVRADVVGAFSARVAHGYPIYRLGYDADRQILLSHVARYTNVTTGGRQGLFRYIFLDAAMEMGQIAAQQILAGTRDAPALDAVRRDNDLLETAALTA